MLIHYVKKLDPNPDTYPNFYEMLEPDPVKNPNGSKTLTVCKIHTYKTLVHQGMGNSYLSSKFSLPVMMRGTIEKVETV